MAPLLLLVRHGQTAGNSERRLQPESEPLSEVGTWQALQLGKALAQAEARQEIRIVAAVVSDLQRTAQTAEAILECIGKDARKVVSEPLLRERNFGDLRGLSFAEVGGAPKIFAEDFHPPGGESWQQFRVRIDEAWSQVIEVAQGPELQGSGTGPEPALLVVTHGLALRTLLQRHLGMPSGGPSMANTGVTRVRLMPAASKEEVPCGLVERLNDTSHLLSSAPLPDPVWPSAKL
mmetsp:Transcript_52258/g.124642  ORF Transcript_52258/g.124642 Transcript_52258/m.124642 type:complete len:234 (+) Transcript_52258:74-775(+)